MLSKGNNPIQDKEWNDKVTKAANSFWSAFQMTENGKPKSGLLVYTFCLSFVMLAVYGGAFFVVIDGLYNLTAGLPVFWGNLIQSLTATILGLLVSILLHFVLRDKRLMFGTYLWLALYAVACLVTLLIYLRGTGAVGALLTFYGWFVAIPLVPGLVVTYYLFRRDYVPPKPDDEPEWKKSLQRR